MKKIILMMSALVGLSGCVTTGGMQGNPAGVMVGAQVGGLVGGLVGDNVNGYRGSMLGSLIGTISGAMLGGAVTTPRQQQEDAYYVDDTYAYAQPQVEREPSSRYRTPVSSSDIVIRNIRFVDANRNQIIDSNETAKVIFEVVNMGRYDVYNVTPLLKELNGLKQLYVSPSATIERIPAGDGIRYTANIRSGKKLKTGEALFQIIVLEGDGTSVSSRTFAIPTQRYR